MRSGETSSGSPATGREGSEYQGSFLVQICGMHPRLIQTAETIAPPSAAHVSTTGTAYRHFTTVSAMPFWPDTDPG